MNFDATVHDFCPSFTCPLTLSGRTSLLFNLAIKYASQGRTVHFLAFKDFQLLPLLVLDEPPSYDILKKIIIL